MKKESWLNSFNAIRALAILLVVLGHAALAYMATKMPELLWVVRDPSNHPFFDWFSWAIQFMAMPLFFFIAGFFSSKKFEVMGANAFIRDRAKRIVIPFVAGTIVILPLVYYVWSYGWYLSGRCELREILLVKFNDPVVRGNLYGPAHLWFLEYLFLISLFYPFLARLNLSSRLQKILIFSPLLLALPTILMLRVNYDAGIEYRNSFIPFPVRFLHYCYFFLAGALTRRIPGLLKAFETKGIFYLVLSAPLLAVTGFFLKRYLAGTVTSVDSWSLSCATALFSWSMLLGLISLSLRFLKRPNAVFKYLSDASFAIYLVHMPVIGLLQVLLYRLNWPAFAKFPVVFFGTLAITIVFYQTTRVPDYLTGVRRFGVFSRSQKIAMSVILGGLIFAVGAAYQFFYKREYARYREIITGYYHKHLNRKPDRIGLDHWTMMALNKWGLQKVEEEGFIKAKARGAR